MHNSLLIFHYDQKGLPDSLYSGILVSGYQQHIQVNNQHYIQLRVHIV